MIATTVTTYAVVKFVHVFAVVFAFGVTYMYAFMEMQARKRGLRELAFVHHIEEWLGPRTVTGGLVVVLGSGIYLVQKGPWEWSDTFISVGAAITLVLFAMGGAFFSPNERHVLELIDRDIQAGATAPSAEYETVAKRIAIGGTFAGLLILAALFFMIVKP